MPLGSISSPPRPSVATRRGIAWSLGAPSEDSSVLVLSTPSKHYIDIRFALSGPSTSGPFWAFAGTAKYTSLSTLSHSQRDSQADVGTGWNDAIRGEWSHPIDSMGNFDGVDRADIFTLANGTDQVEFGTLENPDSGKVELFKEYWTLPAGTTKEDTWPCVMAHSKVDGAVKGMVIRVGRFAQGIVQTGIDAVTVVRLVYNEGKWEADDKSSDGWERVIPAKWVTDESRTVDENTQLHGRAWTIVEAHAGP